MFYLAACVITIIGGFYILFYAFIIMCYILGWLCEGPTVKQPKVPTYSRPDPPWDFERQPGVIYVGDPDSCVSKVGVRKCDNHNN